jgi:4,4'-diaponeurosporenoate glycosyltransferase
MYDVAVYLVGWSCGWLLLWRPRPLPPARTPGRSAVAVIVPARNEAASLPNLVPALMRQLRPGDEVVVVDDHSTDDTAGIATALGARVVHPPPLPDGWLGKPHACWHGAASTRAGTLLFLDADVRPAVDLLDRVAGVVELQPDAVVSLQPWHVTERPVEQASLLFNITALMGSGAFTVAGSSIASRVAFGPVLGVRRDVYDSFGGHSHHTIRALHTEDIGMARAVGAVALFTGGPDTTFRMYPDGLRQTLHGWTRSIATGARYTRWWLALATLAWIWSLAGGWLALPLVYPLSALQVWVLGRRAGSIHPLTALLYPVAVAVFAVVFVWSLVVRIMGRDVTWKGRRVDARPT